jgi:hypothetical protein
MHTHSPNKLKSLTNIICQKADGNCFLGKKEVLLVEFKQGTTVTAEVIVKH